MGRLHSAQLDGKNLWTTLLIVGCEVAQANTARAARSARQFATTLCEPASCGRPKGLFILPCPCAASFRRLDELQKVHYDIAVDGREGRSHNAQDMLLLPLPPSGFLLSTLPQLHSRRRADQNPPFMASQLFPLA